jgi:primosomal protein N' (replication factor Y) (superfamily II helicase)
MNRWFDDPMSRSFVVSVALPLPIRREFAYRVPESMEPPVPGVRVRVPFGERALTGVVTESPAAGDTAGLRELLEVLDLEPACTAEVLGTASRVAERFFVSTGEILKSALPARLPAAGAVRYRITERGALARGAGAEKEILDRLSGGESVRVTDLPGPGRQELLRRLEERGWIRPVAPARERRQRVELAYSPARVDAAERATGLGRSRKGREALEFLEALGRPATAAEIRAETGAAPATLRALAGKGLLLCFEQERREQAPTLLPVSRPAASLVPTAEQAEALQEVTDAIRGRRSLAALLQGVTGSGKTEVYLRAIAAALQIGRGAVWLVPEIALTPFFARELSRQFGDRAAVLHSALSERERGEAWERVRSGRARVVIGPRSAAFAPVEDPGLFVVDEEHDASYKQRESPRYDAREVVAIRARAASAVLLFGSATPSLEAYHAARQGRLRLLELTARVEERALPKVEIVDLRRQIARPEEKGVPLFSAPLVERLRHVFAAGEQAILLQPRRGFAPFLLCRVCGFDFRCSQCSVCRTVHDRGRALVCHYCGERSARPPRCPDCGGALLEEIGAGTERVADRFAALFPNVPHTVLDRDTARRRGAAAVLQEMASGKIACLIGTQMVAKGHDFPRVTAVGVLSADTLLNFPDFRSAEKTYQLVAQVSGRSGRGASPGTVHVQTFHPQHPAIRMAAAHDLDGFAHQELEFRRAFFYPPFSELAAVLVSSPDRQRAESAAAAVGEDLRGWKGILRLSGPAPAPLERLKGRWRFQILLRAADRKKVLAALEAAIPERSPAGTRIDVDVDPQDLM